MTTVRGPVATRTIGDPATFDPQPLACDEPDQAEIKRFYDHYRPILERYARRDGSADPEGIADLAFFDGLRAASTMRQPTEVSFRAYLFRAARSRLIDESRRKSVEQTLLTADHPALVSDDDPGGDAVDMVFVDELLQSLSIDQRRVVRHRFYDGFSASETAARLGKSPGAVRKLQHDAVRRLRAVVAVAGLLALIVLTLLVVDQRRDEDRYRLVVDPAADGTDVEGDGSFDRGGRGRSDLDLDLDADPESGPRSARHGDLDVGPAPAADPSRAALVVVLPTTVPPGPDPAGPEIRPQPATTMPAPAAVEETTTTHPRDRARVPLPEPADRGTTTTVDDVGDDSGDDDEVDDDGDD